jgi:hypothetical protein
MNVHGTTCQDGTIISSSLEFTNAYCVKNSQAKTHLVRAMDNSTVRTTKCHA